MFTKDPQFWQAMRNTLWIIAVGLPLEIAFAMADRDAADAAAPGASRSTGRSTSCRRSRRPVAAALAFVFILNPSIGPVNQILRGSAIDHPPLWFFDPSTSKWGLVFLGLWGVGQTMIIFLAGLLDVPAHLYEAADIEGASRWQRFRYVTLPMMSPVIFFSLVIGVIYGFQYFTAGVRRELRRRGFGAELGRRERRLAAGVAAVLLALPVREGLRELPDGLRIGDGVGAVPDHDGLHRDPDQDVASLGALPGRASDSHDPRAARRTADRGGGRPAPDPAGGAASAVPHDRGQPRRA